MLVDDMFHILKEILYKLGALSTITLLLSVVIFWFYGFFAALGIFMTGLSGILYTGQDLLLYYPNIPPDSRGFVLQPSNFKLPYESIKIKNKTGLKIHMFLIKQETNCNHIPTMIFFHGNAGNMGQRLPNASELYHKLNINILLVEYRGYGLSEGSPSEHGLYEDAQTAFDYIMERSDLDRKKIIVFGRSLGGAIAIDLASRFEYRNKIWALIVENTFTSIPDMAKLLLPWRILKWLPYFCHKNKYMSLRKMGHVVSPTLIICGTQDDLVPPTMSSDLYTRCGAICKKIVLITGGGHNDTWICRDYYGTLQQFLLTVPSLPNEVSPFIDENNENPSTSDPTIQIV
ncbi:protein ABHD13 [Papilio machaon]|nr:protein ABHD13 [Papilio machaon]